MNFESKKIEFKELGEITLQKSVRAKKISISARPFKGIKVTFPAFLSFNRAERFIEEKETWLRKTMKKIHNAERSLTVFDYDTSFQTIDHSLEIIKTNSNEPHVKLYDGTILVLCPDKRNIREKEIQQMIRHGIESAWRKEAKKYLPERLEKLAVLYGYKYCKVTVKNNKSRWGSCSKMNNINLNLHLLRLPRHLSDYVLLHELVHTTNKNHSKKFWRELGTIVGNAKVLDKELKQYRIEIY